MFQAATLAVVLLAVTPPIALAQISASGAMSGVDGSPLLTTNRTIQASLQRIALRSSLWREAMDVLRGSGRHVIVLTPDQVVVSDSLDATRVDAFDPTVLAEAAPVPAADSRVQVVLVVVNLELMERLYRSSLWPLSEFEADLDRVLVHEIYGHAIPYLLAGSLSGRCADPKPHERASEACAIRRENAVRAELGLGQRTDHGLQGLTLARRSP